MKKFRISFIIEYPGDYATAKENIASLIKKALGKILIEKELNSIHVEEIK